MRNTNRTSEEVEDKIAFTKEQMRAIKAVDRAMRKCEKVGVHFWDNYGSLTAFNNKKITCPNVMEDGEFGYDSSYYYQYIEEVYSNNFYAGNADDPLDFDIR